MSWLSEEEAAYPRDAFQSIISLNSPYAFYLFQWVPYQTEARRRRVKMMHDVKAFDGREEFGIWPNGSHCGTIKDEDVEFIRISRTQHGKTWQDPADAATPGKIHLRDAKISAAAYTQSPHVSAHIKAGTWSVCGVGGKKTTDVMAEVTCKGCLAQAAGEKA